MLIFSLTFQAKATRGVGQSAMVECESRRYNSKAVPCFRLLPGTDSWPDPAIPSRMPSSLKAVKQSSIRHVDANLLY